MLSTLRAFGLFDERNEDTIVDNRVDGNTWFSGGHVMVIEGR